MDSKSQEPDANSSSVPPHVLLSDDKPLNNKLQQFPQGINGKCTGTRRDGTRCNMNAEHGGYLCKMHGGRTPLAYKAAQLRLAAMIEPAMAVIQKVLDAPGDTCIVCGRSDDAALMVRTAFGLLDRIGHGPGMKLEVDDKGKPNFADFDREKILQRLDQLKNTISSMSEKELRSMEIVDAEIVEADNEE